MKFDPKSDADVLAEAREYLESHGWWRGALRGPNGRQVCGLGAILYSQGWESRFSNGIKQENAEQVGRILDKLLKVTPLDAMDRNWLPGSDFTSWNDHAAKDKQEVLDVFAKAEKIERAGFDPDAP